MKRLLAPLVAACGLLLAPAARADKLDRALNEGMPEVVKALQGKGYKNVGVLRFRAARPADKGPRFELGPINGNLAQRVENLLVLNVADPRDGDRPLLGVLHDAGAAAQKAGVGSWFTSPAERKKLFASRYPLAWGKESVKPDAFLTGEAWLSADLKKTTVVLEVFDARAPQKLVKLAEISCDTDRNAVRDFNLPYHLTQAQKQKLTKARGARARDDDQDGYVLENARQQQQQAQKPKDPEAPPPPPDQKPGGQNGPASPENVGGIKVTIKANGTDITPTAASSQTGDYELECPARGQEVVISLENTTDKTLGVVLKVGGLSTIGTEQNDPESCRKWVIPPGKTYTIRGFYTGDRFNELKKFVPMTKADLQAANPQLADKLELIEVYTFASEEPRENMTISRGVSARGMRRDREARDRQTYAKARAAIARDGGWRKVKTKDGEEVLGPGDDVEVVKEPDQVPFPNPVELGHLKVRLVPARGASTSDPAVDN